MCAASVYPEPGSNSLKKYFTVLRRTAYFFFVCLLFLLCFPWVHIYLYTCFLFRNLTSSLWSVFRLPSLCFLVFRCSIFKVRLLSFLFFDSLFSISLLLRFVKYFFYLFLSFFRTYFSAPLRLLLFLAEPFYIITSTPACQVLFSLFLKKFQ